MIDLRFSELPSCLECDGTFYELNTSFRVWLEFGRILEEEKLLWNGIFKDVIPDNTDWADGAIEFYTSPNETPHGGESSHVKAYDLILDGEYIVAAFQQAYGIDLTTGDMHWHRFKALFNGLPEETMMRKIIGWRTWTKPKKDDDYDKSMAKLRAQWSFPDADVEHEKAEMLEWANEVFGEG